jgi:NAD+ synthase
MNRIKDYSELEDRIVFWLKDYARKYSIKSFVIGVSGGIDSAVSSTLAAKTGLPVYAIGMPIHQKEEQENLSDAHLEWLQSNFSNVIVDKFDLTRVFETFKFTMNEFGTNTHSLANSRSRLRMMTLYQVATSVGGIVVGTGNKVEDYGVGFYTKYGDGGVDIAPIADLYKTEVWELGRHFGVDQLIIDASPTDGLWDDGRTDEDQIGTSYDMLEWVMDSEIMKGGIEYAQTLTQWKGIPITEEQKVAIKQYAKFNQQNQHKMNPIPTFKL